MQNRRNYYRILQVQPDAPIEVIKNNYRTLLQKLRLHPDLGGDPWNASQINQAWQTLRDPRQRAAYDKQLLRDHHIQALSLGHLAGGISTNQHSGPSTPAPKANRRNYYRVLHIQTDAPAAIVSASYKIQMKNPQAPIELIQEAFAVLSDPQQRSAYDRRLKTRAHPPVVEQAQATAHKPHYADNASATSEPPVVPTAPYQPLITRYCHFCKTPHAHSSMGDRNELCSECASPLFAAPRESIDHSRRGLLRFSRHDDLKITLDWPAREHPATLMDLSPDGLRFTTRQHLHQGQVIKVESQQFKCVAKVMNRQCGAAGESVGGRFIAVLFNQQRGNFVSAQA